MTILDRLAEHAAERMAAAKSLMPAEQMRRMALELPAGDFAFENALKRSGMSFILTFRIWTLPVLMRKRAQTASLS